LFNAVVFEDGTVGGGGGGGTSSKSDVFRRGFLFILFFR